MSQLKRTSRKKNPLDDPEVKKQIELLEQKRGQKSSLDEEIKAIQAELVKVFEGTDLKSFAFEDGNQRYEAGFYDGRGEKVILNQEMLKKKVGAALWRKVTTTVLDNAKLMAHVKTGEISQATLAACSEMEDKASYIKVTVKSL
jgi:hypothetical protein